jgi:hypothetical protein
MIRQILKFLHPRYQNLFLEYKVDFQPRYGFGNPPHPGLYEIINAGRTQYAELLRSMLEYRESILRIQDIKTEKDPFRPVWNNGFLPGLDMIGIYGMLAHFKPGKYVEIGSGNSTKVAFQAIRDQQLSTEIVSIDPQPRAEIDQLASRVIRKPFEYCDLDLAAELGEGDVLFVDNSHRILPNSDAMVFFMELLPRLKKGVIVHLHDIFLPYDYPQFMCDRFYSEQYGLAFYLLANPHKYLPLLPNYFIFEDKELSAVVAPIWEYPVMAGVERHGASFWLTINA